MSHVSRWAAAALVVAAVLVVSAPVADAQTLQAVQGGQGGVRYMAMPAVPGFYMLRTPAYQKELELVDEQKKKLEEIAKAYGEELRTSSQYDWSKLRDMSAEERKAKYAEIRQQRTKLAGKYRQQIEEVLLPHQLQALKQINLRIRGPAMLHSPRVLDQLGFSEEQKEKLKSVREEMQKKMQEIQKEAMESTFELLTPKQQKQLEEMVEQGSTSYGAYWTPATPSKAQATPKK